MLTERTNDFQILVVEDNEDDLAMILHALRKSNLANQVKIARDGVEALAIIFCEGDHHARKIENQPKVIFLDLKLPKIDGLEVLKKIRSDPRTATVPVVILTSSLEDRDVVESYKLGINSYIIKPIQFAQFVAAVQRIEAYWILLNEPRPH